MIFPYEMFFTKSQSNILQHTILFLFICDETFSLFLQFDQ